MISVLNKKSYLQITQQWHFILHLTINTFSYPSLEQYKNNVFTSPFFFSKLAHQRRKLNITTEMTKPGHGRVMTRKGLRWHHDVSVTQTMNARTDHSLLHSMGKLHTLIQKSVRHKSTESGHKFKRNY